MTTERMTVHEALAELKMLDKRITDKINHNTFCYAVKHNVDKIGGLLIEDTKKNIKSAYESITDLIARRAAIRSALCVSNANTKVTIGDSEYYVAEAIEMKKTGVLLQMNLLDKISSDFNKSREQVAYNNGDKLTNAADTYINNLYGSKEKSQSEEIQSMRDAYIKQNSYDLIDPLNLNEKIQKLNDQIGEFIAKVDSKLSVSNAITEIEITY